MRALRLLILLWGCWLSTGTSHAQELHPTLRRGELRLRQVLILPLGIAVVKQGIVNAELLDHPTVVLTEQLKTALQTALTAKGFTVLPDPFSPAALQQDPQLQYELADLQARYDLQATTLHQDGAAIRRGEFTLGKEVADLNPAGQADALVIVRGYGADPTLAKTAYALLVPFGGAPNSVLYLSIALLDARTGDVLWLHRQALSGNFRQPEKSNKLLAKALSRAFRSLP